MLSCVDAVLDESPLVERIVGARRDSLPRAGGWLRLRNPPGPRSTGIGFYVRTERGTPREFVVNYIWPAPRVLLSAQSGALPDPRVADMEGEMLTDIGMRLLEDVRAQCAPNAPGAPACSRVNQGRGGVCVLGTA